MRKGLIVLLAAVLVAAFSLPAMADLSSSGFVRIKGHVDQVPASALLGSYIRPVKDVATSAFVEQRQRFIFDWNSENVGARAYFEIDFQDWGNGQYQSGFRNQGSGLEADTINLETKNFYMWFNVPNTSIKVQAGLQNQSDSYDGVLFGVADMVGVFVTGKMEPVSYRLGWSKFFEGTETRDDDIDLYVAEAKFSPTKEAKLGVNLYMLRDAGGQDMSLGAIGPWNLSKQITFLANDYGFTVTSFTYEPSTFYYLGIDGSVKAGPVALSGWAFYNWGSIENVNATGTLFGAPLVNEDTDVKAWAAALRGDMDLGPGKFFLAGAYVSGTGDSASDFETPVTASNYALAGSFPFYKWDLQLLLPSGDDINNSASLAYDAANKGRGIIAFAAGYSQKFSDTLSGKIGVGYLADAEETLSQNAAGVSIDKHSAIEVNARVNYALVKGLDVGLYGAYAFLTDWESYTGTNVSGITGGNQALASGGSFVEGDDLFKFYARLNYGF